MLPNHISKQEVTGQTNKNRKKSKRNERQKKMKKIKKCEIQNMKIKHIVLQSYS